MKRTLINYIIKIEGDTAYFFNEEGVYSSINVKNLNYRIYKDCIKYNDTYYLKEPLDDIEGITHTKYIKTILAKLKVGDTYDDFINMLNDQTNMKLFLQNFILRIKDGKAFFFNKEGIYSSIPVDELRNGEYENYTINIKDVAYVNTVPTFVCKMNAKYMKRALALLNIGDTFEDFVILMRRSDLEEFLLKPKDVKDFITRIDAPTICRETDNNKVDTFDYIYVEVFFLSTMDKNATKIFIKQHISEIFNLAKEKLLSSSFKKYNVPLNFLKCSAKIDYRTSSIHFIFSLKELPEHNENDSNALDDRAE